MASDGDNGIGFRASAKAVTLLLGVAEGTPVPDAVGERVGEAFALALCGLATLETQRGETSLPLTAAGRLAPDVEEALAGSLARTGDWDGGCAALATDLLAYAKANGTFGAWGTAKHLDGQAVLDIHMRRTTLPPLGRRATVIQED